MCKFFLTLASLLISITLFSQEDTVEVLTVERYPDIESTFPVNYLFNDVNDYIWAATGGGLYAVTSFDQQAEKVLYKNTIALAENKEGKLWVGYEQFVGAFDSDSKATFKTKNQEVLISHMERTGNNIWAATSYGIYVISIEQQKVIRHYSTSNSRLPSNAVNFIHRAKDGIIWVATDNGVCRIKDQNWKVYEKGTIFKAITSTKEGTWLASNREMWLVDAWNRWYPAGIENELSRGTVTALTADSKGRIYIGSDILVQFDPYSNKVRTFNENDGFVNTSFLSLETDKQDNVWIGTARQGLFRIKTSKEDSNKLTALAYVVEQLNCFGDANAIAAVNIKGGEPPYRYIWENETVIGARPGNLAVGDYSITVMDSEAQQVELVLTIQEPPLLILEIEEVQRISEHGLKDGKATVKADGGTPDYKYVWADDQLGTTAKRLEEGIHIVSVTDARGCQTYKEVEIKGASVIPELVTETLEVGQTLQMNQLYFEADSSVITELSHPVLEEVYDFLTENPSVKIEIGGHTNNIPPDDYCFALSTARAKNVATYLYKKGVDPEQLTYHGYGKTTPIASNQTVAGRKRNQRVELKIVSMDK